jgi:biopolymer transport protein TolR
MIRTRRERKVLAEINIVNLVDVCLVLLIIFMLTAPFIQGGIEIELPKTRSSGRDTSEGMVVSVTADRMVYIENVKQDLETLGPELARRYRANPGAPVYLRADKSVPYGHVIEVIAQIKQAGFLNLGLVTEPLSESFLRRRAS